ncbi:hypothetical protein [Burkholderia sp. Z1]|uniref:hypothetical protein n=1 Tax=Burkholderia sp. Z1 TaxID=2759039 RepID=UPI00186930F7|nr:hypothetical protein [Burkholderia sp. Z1]
MAHHGIQNESGNNRAGRSVDTQTIRGVSRAEAEALAESHGVELSVKKGNQSHPFPANGNKSVSFHTEKVSDGPFFSKYESDEVHSGLNREEANAFIKKRREDEKNKGLVSLAVNTALLVATDGLSEAGEAIAGSESGEVIAGSKAGETTAATGAKDLENSAFSFKQPVKANGKTGYFASPERPFKFPRLDTYEDTSATGGSAVWNNEVTSQGIPNGGLGGKVYGFENKSLPKYDLRITPSNNQLQAETQKTLDGIYGEGNMEIVGYHLSPHENQNSLISEGFSFTKNQGAGEGVAGHNKNGPGLYVSENLTSDHLSKDGVYDIYAVFRPKGGRWVQGTVKSESWSLNNNLNLDGDFIRPAPNEIKINPSAISKVGLRPIGQTKLREAPSNYLGLSVPKSRMSFDEVAAWGEEKLKDPAFSKAIKEINNENNPDVKFESIKKLSNDMRFNYSGPEIRDAELRRWLKGKLNFSFQ